MNRSAEQTNLPRTASRFTRFVCPALRFIPHEPRKKDTHSLNIENFNNGLYHLKCMEHSYAAYTILVTKPFNMFNWFNMFNMI